MQLRSGKTVSIQIKLTLGGDCGICLDKHTKKESLITKCGHHFGKVCLQQWEATCCPNNITGGAMFPCPNCRTKITIELNPSKVIFETKLCNFFRTIDLFTKDQRFEKIKHITKMYKYLYNNFHILSDPKYDKMRLTISNKSKQLLYEIDAITIKDVTQYKVVDDFYQIITCVQNRTDALIKQGGKNVPFLPTLSMT